MKVQKTVFAFTLFQAIHIGLFSTLVDEKPNVLSLSISGVACFVAYGWLLAQQWRASRNMLSPIIFYLAASVFRLGIGSLYVANLLVNQEYAELMVGIYDVRSYLMHGHLIAMLGDLLFLLGYFSFAKPQEKQDPAAVLCRLSSIRITYFTVGFYFFSMVIKLASYSISLGALGQLTGYIANYGASGSILVMLYLVKSGRVRIRSAMWWFSWGAFSVSVVLSLFSYMKSDLLIALLPVILLWFGEARDWIVRQNTIRLLQRLGSLAILLYFFLFIVSGYSELRRAEFWSSSQYKEIRDIDIPVVEYLTRATMSAIPMTDEFEQLHKYPDSGVWGMISRMSMMAYPAWAYGRVQTVGYNPDGFFKRLAVAVTPRVLWPGKPNLSPGADFTATIGLAGSGDTARSATALTMQGAYYWSGGLFALVVGCFASGAALALVHGMFSKGTYANPVSAMIAVTLAYMGFHWFEDAFLGSFPFFLYCLLVFYPMQVFFWKLLNGSSQQRFSGVYFGTLR